MPILSSWVDARPWPLADAGKVYVIPGGGEDYDLDARMYRIGRRLIGTSRSWVYHHWSATRVPMENQRRWADHGGVDPHMGDQGGELFAGGHELTDELHRENARLREHLAACGQHLQALLPPVDPARVWNNLDALWPPDQNGGHHLGLLGFWTAPDGTRRAFQRDPSIATDCLD